ncbi:hypothetical protein NX059_011862 [Plenodomus lindquistii]|nr:hypothetical protein NX059_011862 [Plenodomus lindquistii]
MITCTSPSAPTARFLGSLTTSPQQPITHNKMPSPSPNRAKSRSRSRSPRRSPPRRPKNFSGLKYKNDRPRDSDRDRRRDDDRERRPRDSDRERRPRRDSRERERRPRDADRERRPRDDRDRRRDGSRDRERRPRDSSRDRDRKPREPRPEKEKKAAPPPTAAPSNEAMIIVTVNDRLGTKTQVPCLPSDPIKVLKAMVAAKIGRPVHEIMLKRQGERPFHDQLTLADYAISNGVQVDLELNTGD